MAANPIGSMAAVNDQLLKLALMGYGYDPEALDVLGAGTDQPGEMLTRLITEWYFWIPSIRLAEALGRRGTKAYLYEFAWRTTIFDGKMGAGHYLEVPFVFDTLGVETEALLGPKPPQPLADAMHGAWVGFVKSCEPGWAPYDERSRGDDGLRRGVGRAAGPARAQPQRLGQGQDSAIAIGFGLRWIESHRRTGAGPGRREGRLRALRRRRRQRSRCCRSRPAP